MEIDFKLILLISSFDLVVALYMRKPTPKPAPIYNGDYAEPDEFKFIVSIRDKRAPMLHFGAGSIISDRWILTARHVVLKIWKHTESDYFNISYHRPLLVVPKYNNTLLDLRHKPIYEVEQTFCPGFSNDRPIFRHDNDIALIKLKQPIPIENNPYNIRSIHMNDIQFDTSRVHQWRVAGWGKFDRNFDEPSIWLRKATVNSKPLSQCKTIRGFRPYQQICISRNGQGICKGDSGGPGLWKDFFGADELLAGVISYGSPNCESFGVMMDVGSYYDWITNTMRTENSDYICSRLEYTEYNRVR